MKRARKVVSAYRIILEKDAGLGYIGSSIELPAVFADGATAASCVDAIQQALTYAVATMIECGQRPPAAASSGKRDVQINIRLTAQEKLRLSDAARRLGFKGVSDFVRLAALERTSAA
ncbi:MAG: type II toxin-antitoxin system HicB family antitoxin [Planctomycetes bacterium]|nr:type II toxin-antitoxin system HicB family antitoxin [Planctomycetota bacterium]